MREVHGRGDVAAASSLCLMVSQSMWWHSTIVEAYALNALFTILALRDLHRLNAAFTPGGVARLFALGALALYNHAQMGILLLGATAALAAHLLRARSGTELRRLVPAAALGFAVGILPWALTFAHRARHYGGAREALGRALGGSFRGLMFENSLLVGLRDEGVLTLLQFPSPFLPAVVAGAVLLARRWWGTPAFWGLAVMFAATVGFFATYSTWDLYAFLLPGFVILAFAGSFAIARVVPHVGRHPAMRPAAAAALAASVFVPPLVYDGLARAAQKPGPLRVRYGGESHGNTVDMATYLIDPDKHDYRDWDRFNSALFRALPTGSVYVDDDSRTYYQLAFYAQRYLGERPDVKVVLVNAWGFSNWGLTGEQFVAALREARETGPPLFLASLDDPYSSLLSAAPDALRFRFRRFPLDERRWVYKLVTAEEGALLPPAPPRVTRLVVGLDMDTGHAQERTALARDAPIMAALEYETNVDPFGVRFEWLAPDGHVYHVSRMAVPAGHRVAWTTLEGTAPRPPGSWRVRVLYDLDVRELAKAEFTVQ